MYQEWCSDNDDDNNQSSNVTKGARYLKLAEGEDSLISKVY